MKKYSKNYVCLIVCFLSFSLLPFKLSAKEIPAAVLPQIQAKFSQPKLIDQKKYQSLTVLHLAVRGGDYSDAYVIVTPKNKVIDIDNYAILSGINIKTDPDFKTLAKKNPSIDSLWPGNHQYPKSVTLPGSIEQLQFTYSVLNGCHACAIGAIATVGFNFDAKGSFLGTKLLKLSPPPVVSE